MRCNSCSKFVSQDAGDLEADISWADDHLTGTVRIVQCCAECSQELKEYTFDVDVEVAVCDDPEGEGHSTEVNYEGLENDSRSEGKGRYTKTFYGFSGEVEVYCDKCKTKCTVEVKDECMASDMEECQ